MSEFKENSIEWITGQQRVTVTLSQPKYIKRVKQLATLYPDLVKIKYINEDGSIVAHLPLKSIKINLPKRKTEQVEHSE